MSRRKKERLCRCLGNDICYSPVDKEANNGLTELSIDEFEAMRLCDHEGLSQIEAGEKMNISRGTIQRLLASSRKKLIEAMLNRECIRIKNSEER